MYFGVFIDLFVAGDGEKWLRDYLWRSKKGRGIMLLEKIAGEEEV